MFTVRSEDEDRRLLEPVPLGHAGSYPVLSHTAVLRVLENPRRLSTLGYVAQTNPGATVNFRVSGRPAVRIDEPLGLDVSSIYVARDDQVIQFHPYDFVLGDRLPTGWTYQKLMQDMQELIDSLELTR